MKGGSEMDGESNFQYTGLPLYSGAKMSAKLIELRSEKTDCGFSNGYC